MYTALKDKASEKVKESSYLTVPAAIRELEKIEMTRQLDKIYRLDHAVSKTQKVVLSAFEISADQLKYKANYISEKIKRKLKMARNISKESLEQKIEKNRKGD